MKPMYEINWRLDETILRQKLLRLPTFELMNQCKAKNIFCNGDKKDMIDRLILNKNECNNVETQDIKYLNKDIIRNSWQKGSKCEVYIETTEQWYSGIIDKIWKEKDNELIQVKYEHLKCYKSMTIPTDSNDIRPHYKDYNKDKCISLIDGYHRMMNKMVLPNSIIPSEINSICFRFYFLGIKTTMNDESFREIWDKGDDVEIFSNTNQEWYFGKIVDITNDDEGEWLHVLWAMPDGTERSKQVQSISYDIRPVFGDDESSSSDSCYTDYQRTVPVFCRGYIKPSNSFNYPATSSVRRRVRRLLDIEEVDEEETTWSSDEVETTLNIDKSRNNIHDYTNNNIICTMSELSLELAQMFHVRDMQHLTNKLQQQFNNFKQNKCQKNV